MRDLSRKILREEQNVDYTRLIQKLVDKTIVSKYPDDICKIEVEGNTENTEYPRYLVSVIFKISDNHLMDRDLARNIIDDLWMTINRYFEISPSMRSAFLRDCENPKNNFNEIWSTWRSNRTSEEVTEYSRTLKNARQQGVGLRFPKSAIESNPSRFRYYTRQNTNEMKENIKRILKEYILLESDPKKRPRVKN